MFLSRQYTHNAMYGHMFDEHENKSIFITISLFLPVACPLACPLCRFVGVSIPNSVPFGRMVSSNALAHCSPCTRLKTQLMMTLVAAARQLRDINYGTLSFDTNGWKLQFASLIKTDIFFTFSFQRSCYFVLRAGLFCVRCLQFVKINLISDCNSQYSAFSQRSLKFKWIENKVFFVAAFFWSKRTKAKMPNPTNILVRRFLENGKAATRYDSLIVMIISENSIALQIIIPWVFPKY